MSSVRPIPRTYEFSVSVENTMDAGDAANPLFFIKDAASELIADKTLLAAKEEAMLAARKAGKNEEEVKAAGEKAYFFQIQEKDLPRTRVEIDGVLFNQGVVIGTDDAAVQQGLREQLVHAFQLREELAGLHQGRAADLILFANHNFHIQGTAGTFLLSDPMLSGHNVLYRKKGMLYSYESTIPIYCFLKDGKIMACQHGKIIEIEEPLIAPHGAAVLDWYKNQGYEPLIEVKGVFSVDLNNVPPKKPKASVLIEANISHPEIQYVGPETDKDNLVKISVPLRPIAALAQISSWVQKLGGVFVKGMSKLGGLMAIGKAAKTDPVSAFKIAAKELHSSPIGKQIKSSSLFSQGSEWMSKAKHLLARGKAMSEADFFVMLEKTQETLISRYADEIAQGTIQIQEIVKEGKKAVQVLIEQAEDSAQKGVKEVLEQYQNAKGEVESTVSPKPSYKAIAMMFEMNAQCFPLSMDPCGDVETLMKIFKAMKLADKKIMFAPSDTKILEKLPDYMEMKKLNAKALRNRLEGVEAEQELFQYFGAKTKEKALRFLQSDKKEASPIPPPKIPPEKPKSGA